MAQVFRLICYFVSVHHHNRLKHNTIYTSHKVNVVIMDQSVMIVCSFKV